MCKIMHFLIIPREGEGEEEEEVLKILKTKRIWFKLPFIKFELIFKLCLRRNFTDKKFDYVN